MKRAKGFTILELLVVVAILAILAIIAVPSFIGAIDKSKASRELAEVNSISKAVGMYYMDYGSVPTLQGDSPTYGDPKNIDFDKLVPNYLDKLPHFSHWYVDYENKVYHTQDPICDVKFGSYQTYSNFTYKKITSSGSIDIAAGQLITLGAGETLQITDAQGNRYPDITNKFSGTVSDPHDASAHTDKVILNDDFSSGINNSIWSQIQQNGGTINVTDGKLNLCSDAGYSTSAELYMNTAFDKTGVITLEFDITPGAQYVSGQGDCVIFYNSNGGFVNNGYHVLRQNSFMSKLNTYYGCPTFVIDETNANSVCAETLCDTRCNIRQGAGITYHFTYVLNCDDRTITIYNGATQMDKSTVTTTTWDNMGDTIKLAFAKGNYNTPATTVIDNIKLTQKQ